MSLCPVPGCGREAPRNNIFCPDCYFLIPPGYTRTINRMSFEATRADGEKRTYLREQLAGYINVAISHLPKRGGGDVA